MVKQWILLSLMWVSALPVFANNQYVIVIDAGSSGSRVHLFQYQQATADSAIHERSSQKIDVPLAEQPTETINQLQTILLQYKESLRAEGIPAYTVPVHLNATAGMRLQPKAKQAAIYKQVLHALPATGFSIRDARTISGEEEGTFDWLAVNYLTTQHFNKQPGVTIDMGGASMQVTTVDPTCQQSSTPVDVNNHHFCIQPVSYLGLGSEQAQAHTQAEACYPTGYTLANGHVAVYDEQACQNAIDALLTRQAVKPIKVNQGSHIDAISSVYFTVDFFKAYEQSTPASPKVATITRLKQKTHELCAEVDWQSWRERFANVPEKYLKNYCFNGVYLERLFSGDKGFQLDRNQPFRVWSKVQGEDAGWPLGAALYYSQHK